VYLDESEGDFVLCNVENSICQTLKTGHLSLSVLKAVIGSQPCLQGTGFMSAGQKTSFPVNAAKNKLGVTARPCAGPGHAFSGRHSDHGVPKILEQCKLSSQLLMQLVVYMHNCSTKSVRGVKSSRQLSACKTNIVTLNQMLFCCLITSR